MSKIVGIKLDSKSDKYKEKIYYYSTEEDLKKGDQVRVSVPSGGNPIGTVSIQNSKKKFNREIKELEH